MAEGGRSVPWLVSRGQTRHIDILEASSTGARAAPERAPASLTCPDRGGLVWRGSRKESLLGRMALERGVGRSVGPEIGSPGRGMACHAMAWFTSCPPPRVSHRQSPDRAAREPGVLLRTLPVCFGEGENRGRVRPASAGGGGMRRVRGASGDALARGPGFPPDLSPRAPPSPPVSTPPETPPPRTARESRRGFRTLPRLGLGLGLGGALRRGRQGGAGQVRRRAGVRPATIPPAPATPPPRTRSRR